MNKIALVAALFGSAVLATPTMAAPLFYSFTATNANVPNFSFNIDSSPNVIFAENGRFVTTVQNYAVNGSLVSATENAAFYSTSGLGGLAVGNFSSYGLQFFSGTTATPTLLTGEFTLYGNTARTNIIGNLSVTSAVAAIPEPATWAMMLVGFGMVAGTVRYRRRDIKTVYAR